MLPPKIRTLDQLLVRIARRQRRIENMKEWLIDSPAAIQFEEKVLVDLCKQYVDRQNRLSMFLGINKTLLVKL